MPLSNTLNFEGLSGDGILILESLYKVLEPFLAILIWKSWVHLRVVFFFFSCLGG